jgi:pimeloyl-ACP methyl ester carboxylesterase
MKVDYFLGISEEGFHRVVYTEWGSPSPENPPIICVHGLTRNRHDFDAIASEFSAHGCHLYCPDTVGRGDSDWLKDPLHYTYEQYIADMNVMMAVTKANSLDWIGTSMGGLIGMFLASMAKTPIRRLVLNDIGPQIPVKGLARLAKYAGQDPDFSSIEQAKRYFKIIYADFGNLTDEQWQNLTEKGVRETDSGQYITKIDPGIKTAQAKSKLAWRMVLHPLKALEGTIFDVDLWEIWRTVKCPVLVLHGKNSDILLPHVIEKMQKIHPQTEVFEVPDTGHAPALLDSQQQQVIYQFLKKPI